MVAPGATSASEPSLSRNVSGSLRTFDYRIILGSDSLGLIAVIQHAAHSLPSCQRTCHSPSRRHLYPEPAERLVTGGGQETTEGHLDHDTSGVRVRVRVDRNRRNHSSADDVTSVVKLHREFRIASVSRSRRRERVSVACGYSPPLATIAVTYRQVNIRDPSCDGGAACCIL